VTGWLTATDSEVRRWLDSCGCHTCQHNGRAQRCIAAPEDIDAGPSLNSLDPRTAAVLRIMVAAHDAARGPKGAVAQRDELQAAVDAARDIGLGWTKIGDALGIARGNAYQRYRKRPLRAVSSHTRPPKYSTTALLRFTPSRATSVITGGG
jgi:hypothetical protein